MARGQHVRAVGKVLQKVDIHVEFSQKGLILLAQNLLQKLAACLLLQRQHSLLAARSIQQNSQGQRLIRLCLKALERLRHLVLSRLALVRGQVRNQVPFLSFTVKNRSTRFTLALRVSTGVSSGGGAGALLTGGASGEGAS